MTALKILKSRVSSEEAGTGSLSSILWIEMAGSAMTRARVRRNVFKFQSLPARPPPPRMSPGGMRCGESEAQDKNGDFSHSESPGFGRSFGRREIGFLRGCRPGRNLDMRARICYPEREDPNMKSEVKHQHYTPNIPLTNSSAFSFSMLVQKAGEYRE